MKHVKNYFESLRMKCRKLVTWLRFRNIKNNADLFGKIYKDGLWGKSNTFNSGTGSNMINAQQYIDLINKYIEKDNIKTIVDIGCGDFKVASGFNLQSKEYIGCDIVSSLIDYNNSAYKSKNVQFICLDAINNELPKGDLLLVRQVLQHLSNNDVKRFIQKFYGYKHVIVTDELPNNNSHKKTVKF